MIESMIKLAFKSTGIFAAFALAILPYLQGLHNSIQKIINATTTDPSITGMSFQALFIVLCLAIIIVRYTMFSDIAKTLVTGVVSLKKAS